MGFLSEVEGAAAAEHAANEPKQREQRSIDREDITQRGKEGGRREHYLVLNVKICPMLSEELEDRHMAVIKDFWMKGNGVYIWGENHPCYEDANRLGKY